MLDFCRMQSDIYALETDIGFCRFIDLGLLPYGWESAVTDAAVKTSL